MRNTFLLLFFIYVISCKDSNPASLTPPVAKKITREFIEQGKKRLDDYFWLSNSSDSAVINHLKAENAYAAGMLMHTEKTQKIINEELVARIDQKYESLPY